MSDELPEELASLPPPTLINEISYEATLAGLLGRLQDQFVQNGIEYDVTGLEANPGVIMMQAVSYYDTLLRQSINEGARANLLAFADGNDLDILAQFYDVTRLYGETDARLRERVVLAIRGRSPGGTEPRYKSIAMAASPRVADAKVFRDGRDPTIHVAIFSTDNAGVADASLLSDVDAALQDVSVRMVNDTIIVASAAQQAVDVTANVWLLPDAPETAIADAEAALRAAWVADMGLGRDMALSWLFARLQVGGIHHVELVTPAQTIVTPANEALALGTLTLNNMGRNY